MHVKQHDEVMTMDDRNMTPVLIIDKTDTLTPFKLRASEISVAQDSVMIKFRKVLM